MFTSFQQKNGIKKGKYQNGIETFTFLLEQMNDLFDRLRSSHPEVFCKKDVLTGLDKFTSTRPIFRAHNFICAPDRARKKKKKGSQNQTQCARLIDKQLETSIFVLYYLDEACNFHFYCNFIKSFCT